MTLFLRPMLFLRACDRRLAAIRVFPLVRANFVVMLLLGAISIFAGRIAWEWSGCEVEPGPVSLERIFAAEPMRNRYVQVRGIMFPEANLAYRPRRKGVYGPVEYVHVALLGEGKEVLLVKLFGDQGHGEEGNVVVTGLLRPPESQLVKTMDGHGWELGGARVERRYVLVANMTPPPVRTLATVSILSGILTLALGASWAVSRITPAWNGKMTRPESLQVDP